METQGAIHENSSVLTNVLGGVSRQNNSLKDEELSSGLPPEITIAFQTNSLVLAVVCSITSVAICVLLVYCCCRALRSDGSYDCSCTYERPESQTSASPNTPQGSSTVISGSVSFRAEYKHYSFKPKADTIVEESEDSSGVNMNANKNTEYDVDNIY